MPRTIDVMVIFFEDLHLHKPMHDFLIRFSEMTIWIGQHQRPQRISFLRTNKKLSDCMRNAWPQRGSMSRCLPSGRTDYTVHRT